MIYYNIDSYEYEGNFIKVTGWAFDDHKGDIYFQSNYKMTLKNINRFDVQAVFKDLDIKESCGFEIKIKKKMLRRNKCELILTSNDDKKCIEIPFNEVVITPVEEEMVYIEYAYQPLISIVIPVYNTPKQYMDELIDSVVNQSYKKWELCLADGGSDISFIEYLKKIACANERIKLCELPKNLGISGNTNEAIHIARGEYIAFCDHDDILHRDALYEVVKCINENPGALYIYTDEDKLSMNSEKHFAENHKTDFNLNLLEVGNYMNHLGVIEKNFLYKIGLLNSEFDGSQDYDLVLRVAENTGEIYHVKRILYHWRSHENSVAMNPESKGYAYEKAIAALKEHFVRMKVDVEVEYSDVIGSYKVIRK